MSDFICYRFPDEQTFRTLAAAEGPLARFTGWTESLSDAALRALTA